MIVAEELKADTDAAKLKVFALMQKAQAEFVADAIMTKSSQPSHVYSFLFSLLIELQRYEGIDVAEILDALTSAHKEVVEIIEARKEKLQ